MGSMPGVYDGSHSVHERVRREAKSVDVCPPKEAKKAGKVKGSCTFKACNSLCCRQFRLFYPKGTFETPHGTKQRNFKYPAERLEEVIRMSNADYLKLLAWRGINVIHNDGSIFLVFPTAQHWSYYATDEHEVLILPDVPCRYLNPTGTCKIHQRKPAICKDFPRGPDEIPEGCGYRWVEE